ncbi:2-hydroxyacyl-CoA dehydratase subunit D [Paramaledivibacter caminithermalis]|uniref:Benzoyl-CoA reductase/2-hydroxyglutaryl-CoA dehydratase subunit, BcrC/BadD/HgdB n=1 Tax=Paramaledivibacter caminithermalis (strain DSM 15212 / CIP 107654 / DViRD3) TaxID=1121301 RepID=A0A1M6QRI7_PARC5|nr:2-hydroxyacyl-CoA dehydratase family protein [Paramaledivibacter caminithermalis]SHK22902.1 Benzoyl-CoA reductase/2-hydroxyglutaryl-CoA dehydratase subunit, BcrC/BadD/HgdB [Paramaledivibacter caminithermalis DSM 15212]
MRDILESIVNMNEDRINSLKRINKPRMGWISIYTPEEILYAAGITTFRITGERGINTTDANALLSNNYCSYVLSCLSEGIDGVYDFAEGVIFVDACDMRKRLYEAWTRNLKLNYSFFIELPRDINKLSREYYKLQLHNLRKSLETHFDLKISEENLSDAIKTFNKSRKLLQQMYELRKSDFPLISGNDAINIVKASTCGLREEFNEKMDILLKKIEDAQIRTGKLKKHRVMMCGSYFDNSDIIDVIEKTGAILVCEDISNGIKYFEGQINENNEPIDAIADYYLDKATCARMLDINKRFEHLYKLIQEYNVDSVIYFSLKFCDTNLMDYPIIRKKLNEKGIPVLFIEGEQHMTNIESIKTRIQTFLETRMY